MSRPVSIRPVTAADMTAVAAVYAHAVRHGLGTFEEVAPSVEEMDVRRRKVEAYGLPYLVAELDGAVAGYAYAAPFRTRHAYRYTVEDSVYIAPEAQGRGVGRDLLEALIAGCEAMGLRQLLAVIGDSENAGSIRLHQACGFAPAGLMPAVGFKHGRWVDVVILQRALNGGAKGDPDNQGLDFGELTTA